MLGINMNVVFFVFLSFLSIKNALTFMCYHEHDTFSDCDIHTVQKNEVKTGTIMHNMHKKHKQKNSYSKNIPMVQKNVKQHMLCFAFIFNHHNNTFIVCTTESLHHLLLMLLSSSFTLVNLNTYTFLQYLFEHEKTFCDVVSKNKQTKNVSNTKHTNYVIQA